MSTRELVESLRRTGDEKIRALWQEAESEAGRIRAETESRICQIRDDSGRVLEARVEALAAAAMGDAKNRARHRRLSAEKSLSERLFTSASTVLERLREGGYPALFERMALELPALDWQVVLTNPGDVRLAKKYFPKAEIVPDERITGGMDVTAGNGAIRVINTFEKRLERAWAEMLPALTRDVYQEVLHGAPAES
jgi:vacuolar-type H+-ATPase subunit E/Vma4